MNLYTVATAPLSGHQLIWPGGGPRILLAEHETRNRSVMRSLLSRVGYCVRTAQSVPGLLAEARACMSDCSSASFDVVVVDLALPGGDALLTLERLRTAGLRTPIIVLGYGCPKIRRRVARLPLAELVARPVNISLLERRLRALQRRAAR